MKNGLKSSGGTEIGKPKDGVGSAQSVQSRAIGALVCAAAAIFTLAGCSARDPVTATPYYHVGTPTNRSTVQSWQMPTEPYYTQPGVNGGQSVPPPQAGPSQRGFEPYDPLATSVYSALTYGNIDAKYISTTAKDGVVVLTGSVDNASELKKALALASHVTGVRQVRNELTVAQ